MKMTYQDAAQTALQVQDAVNLSGVVHSFAEATSALWDEAHRQGKGTSFVNRHPIATLFLAKLAELNGMGFPTIERPYYEALPQVQAIAEGGNDHGI